MIELRPMSPSDDMLRTADDLYSRAFPDWERIPVEKLHEGMGIHGFRYNAVTDDGMFVGIAYTLDTGSLLYLIYFAIDESVRSRGYGSQALGILRKSSPTGRVFLNIEPVVEGVDNYDQRFTRREFYRRNGFSEHGIVRAPDGNDFMVMIAGGDITDDEVLSIYESDEMASVFL